MNNFIIWLIKILCLLIVISLCLFNNGLRETIAYCFQLLWDKDYDSLRHFISCYGVWAPVISILIMAAQSVVPILPGMALTLLNAWLFGWQAGALYSWSGALLGAVLDFFIARLYGRQVVWYFLNRQLMQRVAGFVERYGWAAVFVTRMLPIIPFKLVSYSAGLTTIKLRNYLLATMLGQLPAIVLYSWLGAQAVEQSSWLMLGVVTLLGGLLVIAGYYFRNKIFPINTQ